MQEVPEYFGKYIVEGIIGRGARGVIYRARDPELGRVVAIKTLSQIAHTSEGIAAFEKEAKHLAGMRHPHIVTLFEASLTAEEPFLVMDYIDGFSLEDLLRMNQTLPPDQVIILLAQIADALDYAHSADLLHRDVKPANILLDRLGKGYLVDFGLAVLSSTDDSATGEGSPAYMAPEAITRDYPDRKSDIYSFAVVAYELLTGELPFTGADHESLCRNIVSSQPRNASSLNPTLPPAVDYVFLQAFNKERSQRFSSAVKFAIALEKALETLGSGIKLGKSSKGEEKGDTIERGKPKESYIPKTDAEILAKKMQLRAATEKNVFSKRSAQSKVSISELHTKKTNEDFTVKIAVRGVFGIVGGAIGLLVLFFFVATSLGSDSFLRRGILGELYDSMKRSVVGVDLTTTPPEKLSSEELLGVLRAPGAFQEWQLLRFMSELTMRNRRDVFQGLQYAIRHKSYRVRLEALKIVEQFKDEESLPTVRVAITDADIIIRLQALKAAFAIHSAESKKIIESVTTGDKAPEVRQLAIGLIDRWDEQTEQIVHQ